MSEWSFLSRGTSLPSLTPRRDSARDPSLRLSGMRPALPKSLVEVSFRASCAEPHERRRVHLERRPDDPPMSKFFEVLHMGGTPECWVHIIVYYSLICQFPSENASNSSNRLQIVCLEVFISPRGPVLQPISLLKSDRIHLDNVRTFGFFGLDVLLSLS